MGKKLVIKGADFSVNGISASGEDLFRELFALVVGEGLVYTGGAISNTTIVTNAERARTALFVDASTLISLGYSSVAITCKGDYQICPVGANTTDSTNYYQWAWSSEINLNLKANMAFNVKKSSGGNIPSDVTLDDVMTFVVS